jgi:hypothetical protein
MFDGDNDGQVRAIGYLVFAEPSVPARPKRVERNGCRPVKKAHDAEILVFTIVILSLL